MKLFGVIGRKMGLSVGVVCIVFQLSGAAASWGQSCSNLVPTMTSDSEPQGQVSSSGIFNSSYPAWKAFDSSDTSMWISVAFETPAWMAYDFISEEVVNRYSIRYANGNITTRAPKDWTFQGRSGDDWVTLDMRQNQVDWAGDETRSYSVSSPGSYQEYRLHVTDDNDDRRGVVVISMGRLSLEFCSSEIFSDGFESGEISAWPGTKP